LSGSGRCSWFAVRVVSSVDGIHVQESPSLLQTSLFTYMMADIGLVIVLAVVKSRVSLSDVPSILGFLKRSIVSLQVEQGRRWNVSTLFTPALRQEVGGRYLTYVMAPPPDFERIEDMGREPVVQEL
jgi:hypothetical protein